MTTKMATAFVLACAGDAIAQRIEGTAALSLRRMLVLGGDTLYTLEVNPAIWVLVAANEAEKCSPIRIVGLGNNGAVGRLRLAGTDAEIDAAVGAVHRALEGVTGRTHQGVD